MHSILLQQFQMSYFGHISYESTEVMSDKERRMMYSIIVDQKGKERKAQEESNKKMRERSKGSWRHR